MGKILSASGGNMIIDDNRKRTDLQPRKEIPDAWAAKARCPLCVNSFLKIMHLPDSPDYFLCPQCEMSFELEMNSGNIRLKNIPEQLMFVDDELRYNWVSPSILRKLMENRSSVIQQKASKVVTQMLSDEEVWNRMLSLYRLGNKPKMIEFMLNQAGATHEQTAAAALKLQQFSEQNEKQQGRKLWLVSAVTFLLIVALVAAGWIYTNNRINAQLEQGRKTSQTTIQPNAPLQLLNGLPDMIKPEFLKAPAPRVEKTGPKPARCPTRPLDAASLFGGESAAWQKGSQPDSWQMITTGKPATIRIPQGMYAGFIDNKTFVFTAADGPSTIYNVNFMVISCQ
jgi:hypothetical protein